MRRRIRRWPAVLGTAFTSAALSLSITGAEPPAPGPLFLGDAVTQAPKEQPKAPVPAAAPEQPAVPAPTQAAPSAAPSVSPTLISDILGGAGGGARSTGTGATAASGSSTALSASQQAAPTTGANVVAGAEALGRASTDAGDLLGKSISATGVYIHKLSPVANEPIVRGYRLGQLYTQIDSGYFFPARQDLDSALSKIDSSQIKNVVVIKGPYSVRYGPGFSFIDIETLDTPRYDCGWETHGSSNIVYKTNGEQIRGLQTFWGGDDKMGFRVGYDIGVGNDYTAGNGLQQESSYNVQNWNAALGYSFDKFSRLEVKAFHLQEHPLDLPGTIYNVTNLITDSVSGRLLIEEPDQFRFVLESWFNYTRFRGNDLSPGKKASINQISNFRNFFGPLDFVTEGDFGTYGGRGLWTFGPGGPIELTLGADFRSVNTHDNNFGVFPGTGAGAGSGGNLAVPRSNYLDPGVFVDATLRPSDRLTVKMGGRIDWVTANVATYLQPQPPGVNVIVGPSVYNFFPVTDFNNQYTTLTAFITPEFQVNERTTLFAGYGVGQRPPTLTELYSMGSFVSMIQQPISLLVGNPTLSAERGQQADLGVRYNAPRLRAGVNGFCSWIHNYITYEQSLLPNIGAPGGVPIYYAVNANQVMLYGGELYAEWEVNRWLMPFGTLSYVRGENLSRNAEFSPGSPQVGPGTSISSANAQATEALPMIPPLEARLGFRIRDPREGRWAVEFSARVLDAQDQVASSLFEQPTGGFTTFDVRTYYRANSNLLVTAGIENFTDRNYFEHLDSRTFNNGIRTGVFQPGFNAYFGVRVTY